MSSDLPLLHGSMPVVGFGCWKVPKETCAEVVEKVITVGYRHLDGACDYGNEVETWSSMERLVDLGLVKNIGLSNWNCQGLMDIFSYAKIKPAVLQIELHPYLNQHRLVGFAQSLGMVVTAFSPLGHGASYSMLGYKKLVAIREPDIVDIANRLGVTPAQVPSFAKIGTVGK